MDKPQLSIVVPIYKAEQYLPDCIESILASSFRNYELLLIDDGGPDNCGSICDSYAETDSRIKVIHKKNAGCQAARNDGISLAQGKWIAFVDADDYVKPDFYQELIRGVAKSDADLILGNYFEIQERTDRKPAEKKIHNFHSFVLSEKEEVDKIRAACFGAELAKEYMGGLYGAGYPWDKLYKLSVIKDNNLKFLSGIRGEDVMFCYQYMKHIRSIYCDGNIYGYVYRILPESLSHGFVPLEILTLTIERFMEEIEKESSCIVREGLYVQTVRLIATALKRYFLSERCKLGKIEGFQSFVRWKKPYRTIAKLAKQDYLPFKFKIFKIII